MVVNREGSQSPPRAVGLRKKKKDDDDDNNN
jgi:hypothetical protein